jgi:adenine-specific DNA methylase
MKRLTLILSMLIALVSYNANAAMYIVGNVPFGDFKVADKRYDKNNFLIHDYFFAKSLDKLRTGGVMLLVTSMGTMDKENSNVSRYIAQRADLLGAIRLPNDTFKGNAGTDVTSDILILQKRDRIVNEEPDWLMLDNICIPITG